MEISPVASRARVARFAPSLLALIAIVALFAMSGFSTHGSTAGHSTITWASIDSFATNVPAVSCCAATAEAPHQGTTHTAASHSDGDHELLAALCAFAVLFVLLLAGAAHSRPTVRSIRRRMVQIVPHAGAAPIPTPSLSVLGISRT